jgi:hypothetical protein
MIVGAHRGAGMKIYMSRSIASTINTARNEILSHSALPFNDTRMVDGGILTSASGTLTVDNNTRMFDSDILMSAGGTLMVDCSIWTVYDSTLMIDS